MTERTAARSWRCDPASLEPILDKARRAGAVVEGNPSEGRLSAPTPLGRLEGRYSYDGALFTITITSRPALLPIEAVWSRLDAILGPPVMMA